MSMGIKEMTKKNYRVLCIIAINLIAFIFSIFAFLSNPKGYDCSKFCTEREERRDPRCYYEAGNWYGFSAMNCRSYIKAKQYFDKAIQLNPQYKEAYLSRSQIIYGNAIEARERLLDLDKAIELDPEYKEAYSERASQKLGENIKDYIGSLEDYNKAILLTEKILKEENKEKEDTIYLRADLQKLYERRADLKNSLKDRVGFVSDYNKAINILSSFIDDRLNQSKANREDLIETYSNLRRLYIERKEQKEKIQDYKGAINDLKKALYYCNLETKKSNQDCEELEIDIAQLAKK